VPDGEPVADDGVAQTASAAVIGSAGSRLGADGLIGIQPTQPAISRMASRSRAVQQRQIDVGDTAQGEVVAAVQHNCGDRTARSTRDRRDGRSFAL